MYNSHCSTDMSETLIKTNRDSSNISIYNNNSASVYEILGFTGLDNVNINNGTSTLVINGLSEYINTDTLFLEFDSSDRFRVENTEFVNPNSTDDYLKLLKGKEIVITDLHPSITDPLNFKGKFIDNRQDVIILENESELNIFKLPRENMLTIPKSIFSGNDIINPYLEANFSPVVDISSNNNNQPQATTGGGFFRTSRQVSSNGNILRNQKLKLLYDTRSLNYDISYLFKVDTSNNTMDVILKAQIVNNTSSHFKNATVTLVEVGRADEDDEEEEMFQYRDLNLAQQRNIYYAKSAPRAMKKASSKNVPIDESQEQKTYDISTPIDIDKKSSKDIVMTNLQSVPSEIQYIYSPQSSKNIVLMSLYWERDNNKDSQIPLPVGNVNVLKKDGNKFIKLGNASISKKKSGKANIRLNLGPANNILADYDFQGKVTNRLKGTYTEKHKITITNKTTLDKTVLLRFRFDKSDYVSDGLDFEVWEPDNKDEPRSAKIGKATINVAKKEKKEIVFSLTYNQ